MANDGPTGSVPVIFAYTGIVVKGNGFADEDIINPRTDGGADNRPPPEISKMKQARDKQ